MFSINWFIWNFIYNIPCSCFCCSNEKEDYEKNENDENYEKDENEIDATDSLFNNELSVKNTVLRNDFEPTSNENNLEEKYYNPSIDNITRLNNNCNDEIKRVESDYSNAPLPVDLFNERQIYEQNHNQNNNWIYNSFK